MQIFGPFRVSTTQAAGPAPRLPQPSAQPAGGRSAAPIDQLDLSAAASRSEAASAAGESSEIRVDRVADLRRQIASGNYDTPERLDAALERMLDRLG